MINTKSNVFTLLLGAVLFSSSMMLAGCSDAYKKESTGQYIDSSVITAKVKSQLLADEGIGGLPISVKTYKDTVQLSGFVNNVSQKAKAEHITRQVEGVKFVQNSIMIKRK